MLREELAPRTYLRVLKSDEPVALDPLQLTSEQITAELEEDLAERSELIDALRQGPILHPVPEMPQTTAFSVDGSTKNFWIKLFYSNAEPSRIERVHIMGAPGEAPRSSRSTWTDASNNWSDDCCLALGWCERRDAKCSRTLVFLNSAQLAFLQSYFESFHWINQWIWVCKIDPNNIVQPHWPLNFLSHQGD